MHCYLCNRTNNPCFVQNKYENSISEEIVVCYDCEKNLGLYTKVCVKCGAFRSLPFNKKTNKYRLIPEKTYMFPEKYIYTCECRLKYIKNTIEKFDLIEDEIIDLIEYLQKKIN